MNNREVDKKIAELLGLDLYEGFISPYGEQKGWFYSIDYHTCVPVKNYTTDIKAAWEIVEDINEKLDPIKNHFFELLGTKILHMDESDAAEFICKCALEVL